MSTPRTAKSSKNDFSTSMFYMWRCIVAIAHADGVVHEKEREYLARVFQGMERVYDMKDEHRQAFADDLIHPKNIADLLRYINDPACRAQLIYFGGLLARADGVLDVREDAILKKLHADQLASLDMEQIRSAVRQKVQDEMFRHDLAKGMLRPQKGLAAVIDDFLLWLNIDIYD